jgi:hypothetical protein
VKVTVEYGEFQARWDEHLADLRLMAERWRGLGVATKAVKWAKGNLKPGDRVRCRRYCVMTFTAFEGQWMVSKAGHRDYHPATITHVNGRAVPPSLSGDSLLIMK